MPGNEQLKVEPLDPWIIEEIRRRERREKDPDRPQAEIIDQTPPDEPDVDKPIIGYTEPGPVPDSGRGVVIIPGYGGNVEAPIVIEGGKTPLPKTKKPTEESGREEENDGEELTRLPSIDIKIGPEVTNDGNVTII